MPDWRLRSPLARRKADRHTQLRTSLIAESATERLRKRLGDGIRGDVLVAGEGEQRAPQAIAVIAVHRLDIAGCSDLCHGYRHDPIGSDPAR